MNVAIYIRTSNKYENPDNQRGALNNYCKKRGWKIYDEYFDVAGHNGSRPNFERMYCDARKLLFDIVLFWALDRFSRSGATYTLQKLKELDNLGILWHSYSEPYINNDDPQTKDITIAVISSFAKFEREKISERTKEGLRRAKEKGVKLGRKPIPEDVVEKVIELLEEGKLSYRKISEKVTYKTKYGKVHHVSHAQVSKIKKEMNNGQSDNLS